MHTPRVAVLALAALIVGSVGLSVPVALAQSPTPPKDAAPVVNEEMRFDVFVEDLKVGSMRIKILSVRDVAIIDHELSISLKGQQEAGFESQITFRGTDKPVPQRGKVSTHSGTFKLMDGTLAFTATAAGGDEPSAAKAEITGYADAKRKPISQPLVQSKEILVPSGQVLTFPALLYFAPRLLANAAQLNKVVYMRFPEDIDYPAILDLKDNCVLSRGQPGADGRTEYSLRQVFAGGNPVPLASLTFDRDGKVVAGRYGVDGKYTIRPPAAAPAATTPTPGTPTPTPAKTTPAKTTTPKTTPK